MPRFRPLSPSALLVPLAALALTATACGGDDDAGAATFDVELGAMVIVPATLTVPAGEVVLHVTNTDMTVHDLVVNSKGTPPLQPGQSYDLPLGEIAAGEYRMWCDQQGHEQMVGALVVTDAPATTAAG